MKRIGLVLTLMLICSSCAQAVPLEQYEKNFNDFDAAIASRVDWQQEPAVPAAPQVKVPKIIGVKNSVGKNYTVRIVKGVDTHGVPIELRMQKYTNTSKVKALCLYKGSTQASCEEEYIDNKLLVTFNSYENPDSNFTLEVTPANVMTPLAWDSPINVVFTQKGVSFTGTITLIDKNPEFLSQIKGKIGPIRLGTIGAINPYMLGAVLPLNSATLFNSMATGTTAVQQGQGTQAQIVSLGEVGKTVLSAAAAAAVGIIINPVLGALLEVANFCSLEAENLY